MTFPAADAIVHVVDDDSAVRDALTLLLRSVGLAVRAYESADAFLAGYDAAAPACLVLDIRMPRMSGLELQRVLTERGARVPILFITGHGDVPMAVGAMKSGAFDFLQKPFNDQDLIDRVQRALDHAVQARESEVGRAAVATRVGRLTAREREVFERVVRGQANKVIAAELGLSERTVEIHRGHVMEKMEAQSLADLIRMSLTPR